MISSYECWERFEKGQKLSDSELISLIEQASLALPYLYSRGKAFRLAYLATLQDREVLKGYAIERDLNVFSY